MNITYWLYWLALFFLVSFVIGLGFQAFHMFFRYWYGRRLQERLQVLHNQVPTVQLFASSKEETAMATIQLWLNNLIHLPGAPILLSLPLFIVPFVLYYAPERTLLLSLYLIVLFIWLFLIKLYRYRRLVKIILNLPNGIDFLARSIASGQTTINAIESLSREDFLISPLFKRIHDKLTLGHNVRSVLEQAAKQEKIPEFSFCMMILIVQHEAGGNGIKALSNLSAFLRERTTLRHKIKSNASEGIASAIVVGALPFLVIASLMFINPQYLTPLYVTPAGHHILIAAGLTELIGILTMIKIVRIQI